MDRISDILNKKKTYYNDKLKTFISWSTKKCSMNGTSDKYIRQMFTQMCRELNIPSSSVPGLINNIYSREFDASSLVNKVYVSSEHKFDILSKDETIRKLSVESAINSLTQLKVHTTGLDSQQLAGMCVFVQFVLMGGRSELEGFGVSPDLVEKWKKDFQKMKKKEIEEKRKAQMIEMEKAMQSAVVDDEDEKKDDEEKIEQVEVPESWEDF